MIAIHVSTWGGAALRGVGELPHWMAWAITITVLFLAWAVNVHLVLRMLRRQRLTPAEQREFIRRAMEGPDDL